MSSVGDLKYGLDNQEINPDQAKKLRKQATAEYREATGEYLKFALPQAMKYGGGEMASWQSDLRMFMEKQRDMQTGDPAADSKNLNTIARSLDQSIAVSLGAT